MHEPPRKKSALKYVPWVAIIAFLFIFVGVIVWATGANTALSNTNDALTTLSVEADGYVQTIHSVAVGASVVCCLMAALMVLMSGGRTCLERAVDQRGKAVCGSWLWLATEAVLCAVWWLILFWLVFVIFGSCLWYGATYTVRGVLQVSINTAVAYGNSTVLPPSPFPSLPPSPPLNITNSTVLKLSPPPRSPPPPFVCASSCLNLALFNFLVQKDICVCSVALMSQALYKTNKAYDALGSVVAGAFLMWCGASFLLMSSVADFAKTKRERELLLRAQRAAVDAAAGQLALGTAPGYAPGYGGDTLPLIKTQQMQQAALQQQQMQQMQMAQMMAQAQAAHMRPPGQVSTGASQQNMGHQV
ncbi:hypothetical protein CHLRE_03g181750v5 [Chlamydomonas reinhardtii]|uniref:Uncharacterized protein n=1 Tax=Chlamydomonas reinhardtii TaxID=3055 RepID=A0A2K3DXT2_CHLRE|nr:uncharacterized protein CHLRE_03g181750v5 [Chlamydomonas reinhardtii]XP_042926184.1 uncharacterized protein CHLRE_03g181750v5 [Chlamydomonas reinhardtii]PNW85339.1 hypothetical protein CHLRE_03g181750v5 [Chlamydomonas reinhardtii]PNW85340.1 hypothetical protein CHLRE_03g181750v5 [Chlamydomonas reinhardtii]